MFNNKTIFITGGTGSFGKSFVKHLLEKYKVKKIIIFSRDELKQYEMSKIEMFEKNKKLIRFFIGDIRDIDRLRLAFRNNNIDYVVHTAALKQVNASEYNPFEFIKTNIIGSQNIIQVCLEFQIRKVIALSTDKAAAPINLYGATKLCADKLFISSNVYSNKTLFSVIRYGNVMGSRGSVVPIFLKLKEKNIYPITDPKMTRFNITLPDAIKFVCNSISKMRGGEIFVPKIPSFQVIDLVKAISKTGKINVIGLRPGEKIHEEMITKSDAENTLEFKDYFIIYNNLKSNKSINFFKSKKKYPKPCEEEFSYSSNKNKIFLSPAQIKKLINDFKNTFYN